MSKFKPFAAVAATAVLAAGLTIAPAAMATTHAFDHRFYSVITQARNDPNYKVIPLKGDDDKQWFVDECNAVYQGKLTKEQFVAEGAQKFPGYEASFQQLAEGLTRP